MCKGKMKSKYNKDIVRELKKIHGINLSPDHAIKDSSEEKNNIDIDDKNSYSFTSKSYFTFTTISYIIQDFIFSNRCKYMILSDEMRAEYNYDYNKYKQLITKGSIFFYFNKQLFVYYVDYREYINRIISNNDVSKIIINIKDYIKNKNPLRKKHLHLFPHGESINGSIKKFPEITFDKVILNDELKQDIKDNTIFHLQNIKENNGIILFGPPGTGKSLISMAIINDAINKGFNTCYLCERVNFEELDNFVKEFLLPCIIIFEDIDSLGQNRQDVINIGLSSFLQFINGLSESKDQIVFVATTNFLDHLDNAIKERPMRFNRKFEFKYPNNEEIDGLLELYFDKNIKNEFSSICYNNKFTGSHIKEIKRTATILSLKQNRDIKDVFKKSVDLIKANFSTTLKKAGF